MDPHIKVVKDLPPPDKYPTKSVFDQTENQRYSKKVKINPRLKKNTYIDQINEEGKKTKIGVGSYNLEKTQKEIDAEVRQMKKKKKMGKSTRISYYEDIQTSYLGIPGAGNYNHHDEVQHIKADRMTPDKWREKHKSESKAFIQKKRKEPAPNSYRPASAGTFDRKQIDYQKERKKKSKSFDKGFGTDAKF